MFTASEQDVINQALSIIESKFKRCDFTANSADEAEQFCRLQIGSSEIEKFGILYLDTQHQLIESEILFTGTIDRATIHMREVLKQVILKNAASVLVYHCHPSGHVVESPADVAITNKLVDLLRIIDVPILDHIIVSPINSMSFKKKGLL